MNFGGPLILSLVISYLRSLFVEELKSETGDYDDFVIDDDIDKYRNSGAFASGTEDLVVRVLPEILKASIIVITSGVS